MAAPHAHVDGDQGSANDRLVALKKRYPGREAAIDVLAKALDTGRARTTCVVYGPAATGKTAVVRWGCRHAAPACPPVQPPQASAVATPHFSQH
jgi:Cdc6-like AAA superfamily ATPase